MFDTRGLTGDVNGTLLDAMHGKGCDAFGAITLARVTRSSIPYAIAEISDTVDELTSVANSTGMGGLLQNVGHKAEKLSPPLSGRMPLPRVYFDSDELS